MEYVIEAHDTDDMRSWLATIKYCMRSPPMSLNTSHNTNNTSGNPTSPSSGAGDGSSDALAPELPPRRAGDRISSSSNFELGEDLEPGIWSILN